MLRQFETGARMTRLTPALNALAASGAVLAVFWHIRTHERVVVPIVLFFLVVGVPAIAGLLSAALGLKLLRQIAIGIHALGLVLLATAYVLCWMVSPGSGAAATLPIGLAGLINYLSMNELREKTR